MASKYYLQTMMIPSSAVEISCPCCGEWSFVEEWLGFERNHALGIICPECRSDFVSSDSLDLEVLSWR